MFTVEINSKNSTDFNGANNSSKAFDRKIKKSTVYQGIIFFCWFLNNKSPKSSGNKPVTEVKKKSKALTEKAGGDMPPAEHYDTLHHTWTFNTRIKTRRGNRIAEKHVHFSIHLDFLPHHLEEIQISQEIVQTSELGLPSLDLEAKHTVSFAHSSPGKYCLVTFRNQRECPCHKFSNTRPHIQSHCTEEPTGNLFLEAL